MADNHHIPTMPQTSVGEHIPTMPQTSVSEHIPTMPQTSVKEHVPTMPQTSVSEHIPTMPQTSVKEHVPTMPQTNVNEHVPTMPQTSVNAHVPTIPQNDSQTGNHISTIPQVGSSNSNLSESRLLYSEIPFTDDAGQRFLIIGNDPVSTDTGEAQIYKCKKLNSTEEYVAKILVILRPDSSAKKLKTRKKVIDFLDKFSANPNSHILPLIGHGIMEINGGQYFVDVYPYCPEGDLGNKTGEFTLAKLMEDVIPAVNEAIHLFHQEGLVHRDLKPDNLFYYNNQIVIGDFGITCELNTDHYAVDTEKVGTLGYFAPELMSEAAIVASDYYSFGQTIWTLYHGDMMYKETIRSHGGFFSAEARNTVSNLMRNNELPGIDEIDKKDEFFEVLMRGLLKYDTNTRFGYQDVLDWLNGDKSLYLRVTTLRNDEIFDREIVINGNKCIDNEQVAMQLSNNWNQSLNILYDDTLYNQYKYTLCRDNEAEFIKLVSDEEKALAAENASNDNISSDIGLCRVIMRLSDNKILGWKNRFYSMPNEISETLERVHLSGESKEDMYVFISTGVVGEWLENIGGFDKKVLDEISRLKQMAQASRMGVKVAYHWMQYMFSKNRDSVTFKDCKTLDDVANMLLKDAASLYNIENELCCVENPVLLGFLCALGYDDAVSHLITDADINYKNHYEMLFDLLENNVKQQEVKELVRNAYCEFGPMAHLIWWKRNLTIYKFVGLKTKTIEQNVSAIKINPSDEISIQRGELSKLQQFYDDFKKYFIINYLIGLSGIRRLPGKDYIYCGKLSGLLAYHFLEQDAPLGYKYSLKI